MSYQALYRKYRPMNFDEVVGQRQIIQTLKNAVKNNRISHAYLFCGPRGTGKTSIAKIFARMLNCTDPQNAPCNECPNCKMALSNSHPDIIEIDAASNNGVDEVRNLIDRVKYAPMEGKYKVYIIDEVHMMTKGAFNALLKTIEEPPEHVIFIFATTEPNKVLSTIISRCQRFDFSKVGTHDIIFRLKAVCAEENITASDEALELIAQLSDGGMRDSLSILDQCVAYCDDHIEVKDVRDVYGIVTKRDIGQLLTDLKNKEVEKVIGFLHSLDEDGFDLQRFTADTIRFLKESLIVSYSSKTQLVDESTKEILHSTILDQPIAERIRLMNILMDTYSKFSYASHILDYIEGAFLQSLSYSYDSEIEENREDQKPQNVELFDFSKKNLSEQSEIDEKTSKIHEKQSISHQNPISDVSRETPSSTKNVNFRSERIRFEDSYFLGLLVGANKTERKNDELKYSVQEEIMNDLRWMRDVNSLKTTKLIASGINYMIIETLSQLEADEINEMEMNHVFDEYIESLLGKNKKIFAISKEQYKRVLEEFKQKMKTNDLPEPIEVVFDENTHKKDPKSEHEKDLLNKVFPTIKTFDD